MDVKVSFIIKITDEKAQLAAALQYIELVLYSEEALHLFQDNQEFFNIEEQGICGITVK